MKKIIFILCTFALFTLFFACKVEDATETKKYTVTIVLNEGTGISELAPMVEEGGTLTLTNPTRTGYVFKGWSTTNKLDNLNFISGNTKVTSDLTIYAMFVKLVTLTFDANGGTINTQPMQVGAGTSVTLSDTPTTTKPYYIFSAYKDDSGNFYNLNTPIVVNTDMTLTAQWSVDLNAIRNELTGGTTTGVTWGTAQSGTILFKMPTSPTNPLQIDYVVNYGLKDENHSFVLAPSDNPNYLAKFDPGLPYNQGGIYGDYLVTLSPTEFVYHYGGTPNIKLVRP